MTYLNVIYINIRYIFCVHASLVAQTIKHLPTIWETWLWSLDREDPLEKEMATHFSILAWKILWMEEPGRLQSTESQRVEHNWATKFFFLNTQVHVAGLFTIFYVQNDTGQSISFMLSLRGFGIKGGRCSSFGRLECQVSWVCMYPDTLTSTISFLDIVFTR